MAEKQYKNFTIGDKRIELSGLWLWLETNVPVDITPSVKVKMSLSRRVVENCLMDEKPHYGINTGFGSLANVRIQDKDLSQLQVNLVRSHATGVGPALSDDVVKTMMLLRANVLAMGYSGARFELLEEIVKFINSGNVPHIPSQGSVGASGDLAPLAHFALALLEAGVTLAPKEGLALINGTQASLAVAVVALRDVENLIRHANIAAGLTVEGLRGSATPFDKRISDVRPHNGHAAVAKFVGQMIEDSEIIASHKTCPRVQDPYSLRCIPQVHGAVVDAYNYVKGIIETEISACTDNPLIFGDEIISGGNFHGTPIALACDHLACALTVLGNTSERRIEQMINPKQGEIPVKYLTKNAGLNSGFMVTHVVSSALASENKALSHPASADSITTSGGQEDFVSMSMWAARKLSQIISNTQKIIAIELLAAAQAIDMQERRLKPGKGTQKIYNIIRRHIPTLEKDRAMAGDIEKITGLMRENEFRF